MKPFGLDAGVARATFSLACILALSACATPTGYSPASGARAFGYSDQQIEANRYRVTVRGNSVTDQNRVESLLLYRAADLTLQAGFDYFILTGRVSDANKELSTPGPSAFGWGLSWYSPRWGWRQWDDPLWADSLSYREITRFEAGAEVAMFRGQKPDGDPNAYDARSVKDNLSALAAAPPR